MMGEPAKYGSNQLVYNMTINKTVEDIISEDDIERVAIVVMNRFDSMMGEPAKDGSYQLIFYPIDGG